MTVLEMAIALFILTIAMVAIVQLVANIANQRRAIQQRRVALQELANQSERIALFSWDDTAPEKLITWQPSPDLTATLPRATCSIAVTSDPDPPMSRRLRLTITWPNTVNQPIESSLTTWKFASTDPASLEQ